MMRSEEGYGGRRTVGLETGDGETEAGGEMVEQCEGDLWKNNSALDE